MKEKRKRRRIEVIRAEEVRNEGERGRVDGRDLGSL